MNPAAILTEAKKNRVEISVQAGKIKLIGEEIHIGRLVPFFETHKAEIISFLNMKESNPVIPELRPCPICGGRDFIHGFKGGYFCVECQPDVRPGISVKAGGSVRKK